MLIVKAICVLHNTIIDKEGIDHSVTDENPQNAMYAPLIKRELIRAKLHKISETNLKNILFQNRAVLLGKISSGKVNRIKPNLIN